MEQSVNNIWTGLNEHLEGFVLKKVGNKEIAKDIIHDVFIKVQSKIHTLNDKEKISSWIFQITRNSINDHFRHQQKTNSTPIDSEQLEDQTSTDETHEFAPCINPMINGLPEKYKEAIMLSEIEGLSQKELAERLGISYSGAKSRVQRGRDKLKKLLLQCCTISSDSYGNILAYQQKKCSGNCD